MARAGHRGRNAGRSAADERSAAGDLAELETVLGHSFHDRAVLQVGLRHSSLGGHGADGNRFDRFEFLGDRVIGLVVAELLLNAFPNDGEGDIARRHARLVNRDSLAPLARAVELGRYLRISPREAASGSRDDPAGVAYVLDADNDDLFPDRSV